MDRCWLEKVHSKVNAAKEELRLFPKNKTKFLKKQRKLASYKFGMKLLTHNMLTSKCVKGVTVGYPLAINASDIQVSEQIFNSEFIAQIIPKLDWPVLTNALESIGQLEDFPKQVAENFATNEEFLKKVHHALLEIDIVDGELVCPESGRKFPINNGIPNMLLNEDEI